jgi:hypothetical protein
VTRNARGAQSLARPVGRFSSGSGWRRPTYSRAGVHVAHVYAGNVQTSPKVATLVTPPPDPRRALSRARLLDAAISLLRSDGPSAVTVDSVTRSAKVARATLYRHFPCFDDLLAATFAAALPTPPTSPHVGSLRERLIKVLTEQADSIANFPTITTALCWLVS